jgi:hypothetical protein
MSEINHNTLKRENITASIVFFVIFAIGSFVFYKKTENVAWAVALFICSIVLLGFYSKILALEEQLEIIEECEEEQDEEPEEDEEEDDEEIRRSIFIKNLPAFKKEAKIKYNETAKQLGKTVECLSDGIIDVWLVDGRIVSMLKWKQIENELEDFDGEYSDMIVEGMSGRNVEFEYGLERYKNMTKYGADGVKHTLTEEQKEEDEDDDYEQETSDSHSGDVDPELAEILEKLEAADPDELAEDDDDVDDNNLIAQIFKKLMQ